MKHVLILGGGFGGLAAARALKGAPVRVTLIDRRNHHLFQPLLYQVATAGLSAPDIAAPIRKVLRKQKNVTTLLGEAETIAPDAKSVILKDGEVIEYDYLVVATGASHSYFGKDEWAPFAPGLKSVEDAFEIRRRILLAYEQAERERVETQRRPWLTFVVVGGGPTGVELAGALAEISRHSLTKNFRNFDPSTARVVLLEGGPRVLGAMPEELSTEAVRLLNDLGVEVRVKSLVTGIDADGVFIGDERINSKVVLWAAGVKASPLGKQLTEETDRAGRVIVGNDMSVPGYPEIFVVGDLARLEVKGVLVPGVAPAAIQAGRHTAWNILEDIAGRPRRAFVYRDQGTMATVGRARAVAEIGDLRFSGFWAWAAWLGIHLVSLIGFRNRLAVLFEWAWAYWTYQRSARVILDRKK